MKCTFVHKFRYMRVPGLCAGWWVYYIVIFIRDMLRKAVYYKEIKELHLSERN